VSVARQVQSYFDKVASGYQRASQNPLWGSVRRYELQALLRMAGPVAGCEVLELGCGAGFYTRLLLAEGARHVHAVDVSERMLAELPRANVTPLHGDAATVDTGRTFALLVSAGMLEFVPDPVAVLRNAARLAAPGAILAILFPTSGLLGRAYRRFHRGHGLEIRLFSELDVRRLAADAGWSVARLERAGPYSACARLERVDP
jgi:ubiquinone/menaquinone biosynthesis C-methylase UbiE